MKRSFLFAVLLGLLMAIAIACDDEDEKVLTSDHPGWQQPDCLGCHTESHNQDKVPADCAGCHGRNGAPDGHTSGDCSTCHSAEMAWHGPAPRFPVERCPDCHVTQ